MYVLKENVVAKLVKFFEGEGEVFFYDWNKDAVQKLVDIKERKVLIETSSNEESNEMPLSYVNMYLCFDTADEALEFRTFMWDTTLRETMAEIGGDKSLFAIKSSYKAHMQIRAEYYRELFDKSRSSKKD